MRVMLMVQGSLKWFDDEGRPNGYRGVHDDVASLFQ